MQIPSRHSVGVLTTLTAAAILFGASNISHAAGANGLSLFRGAEGFSVGTAQSTLPVSAVGLLGLPYAYDVEGDGESLLAIGPVNSVREDATGLAVGGIELFVLPTAVTATADGVWSPLGGLEVGQMVAVAGDSLGPGWGLARTVVILDTPFIDGASVVYVRGWVDRKGKATPAANLGSVPTPPNSGWFEAVAMADRMGRQIIAISAGPLDGATTLAPAVEARSKVAVARTESAISISGGAIRPKGISGSGIRPKGISGSGIRPKGISGSGIRPKGISGSGIRPKGISGSGIRPKGISGSGIRPKGISGSGIRAKSTTTDADL
jgi:hypothetical protein